MLVAPSGSADASRQPGRLVKVEGCLNLEEYYHQILEDYLTDFTHTHAHTGSAIQSKYCILIKVLCVKAKVEENFQGGECFL